MAVLALFANVFVSTALVCLVLFVALGDSLSGAGAGASVILGVLLGFPASIYCTVVGAIALGADSKQRGQEIVLKWAGGVWLALAAATFLFVGPAVVALVIPVVSTAVIVEKFNA